LFQCSWTPRLGTLDLKIRCIGVQAGVAHVSSSWEQDGGCHEAVLVAVRRDGGWLAPLFHGMPADIVDAMIEQVKRGD